MVLNRLKKKLSCHGANGFEIALVIYNPAGRKVGNNAMFGNSSKPDNYSYGFIVFHAAFLDPGIIEHFGALVWVLRWLLLFENNEHTPQTKETSGEN